LYPLFPVTDYLLGVPTHHCPAEQHDVTDCTLGVHYELSYLLIGSEH
jgi:hypothetical protein